MKDLKQIQAEVKDGIITATCPICNKVNTQYLFESQSQEECLHYIGFYFDNDQSLIYYFKNTCYFVFNT